MLRVLLCCALLMVLSFSASAERGGWSNPTEGWYFVEEWNEVSHIPPPPTDENAPNAIWVHNNGSDSFSGNAHSAQHVTDGWQGGDVVRLDIVSGQGDTENGNSKAADASVLTFFDLGDPRSLGTIADPSDRKLYLQHVMTDALGEPIVRPLEAEGITILYRFRALTPNLTTPYKAGANFSVLPHDNNGDKPQIGFGYFDMDDPTFEIAVGASVYSANTINFTNRSGSSGNPVGPAIVTGIDPSQFHSVWMTAKTVDPAVPDYVRVKAWVDGSLTPNFEMDVLRAGLEGGTVDEEGDKFQDKTQTLVCLGSQGTGDILAMQIDYICANPHKAIEPQAPQSDVDNWLLY
jgi:hypothetical protein